MRHLLADVPVRSAGFGATHVMRGARCLCVGPAPPLGAWPGTGSRHIPTYLPCWALSLRQQQLLLIRTHTLQPCPAHTPSHARHHHTACVPHHIAHAPPWSHRRSLDWQHSGTAVIQQAAAPLSQPGTAFGAARPSVFRNQTPLVLLRQRDPADALWHRPQRHLRASSMFIRRLVDHLLNQVLVEGLANRCGGAQRGPLLGGGGGGCPTVSIGQRLSGPDSRKSCRKRS